MMTMPGDREWKQGEKKTENMRKATRKWQAQSETRGAPTRNLIHDGIDGFNEIVGIKWRRH